MVGDQVVGAMRRVAQGQEFRSNVHRGGLTEPVVLDETYCETAVRAAQIMGLRVAGVDMLEGKDGPQIMEVNSSPGLEGIERCTQLDIAGAIIDYIAAQVDFPGDRPAPATDCQPRLWRHRDPYPRRFGIHRQGDQRIRIARSRYQRPDAISRYNGDSKSTVEPATRSGRSAALFRQAGIDARSDSRQSSPQATPKGQEFAGSAGGGRSSCRETARSKVRLTRKIRR